MKICLLFGITKCGVLLFCWKIWRYESAISISFCLIEGQCLVKQTRRYIIDENKRELFIFIVGHHNLQLNLFRSLFSASSQLWYCHLPVIKGIDQPTQNSRRKLFRYFTTNWVLPANMLSNPVFFAHFRFLDENIAKGTTDPRVEFISQDHRSQFTLHKFWTKQFQNLV